MEVRNLIALLESNTSLKSECRYWFTRCPNNNFKVKWLTDNALAGTFILDENTLSVLVDGHECDNLQVSNSIIHDFEVYRGSSIEYLVGCRIHTSSFTQQDYVDTYQKLLLGCVCIRNKEVTPYMLNWVDWLDKGDFYTAPSSTRFHDAYESGLLIHSMNVYNQIVDVWKLDKFKNVTPDSFTLVALTHDWCKIGLYEGYMRNVKNEITGRWESVQSYRWRDSGSAFPFGHGASSMFLVNRFFKLSTAECLSIRWHMGNWNVADNEVNDLQKSNETEPLVHMLQFADQLSIVNY